MIIIDPYSGGLKLSTVILMLGILIVTCPVGSYLKSLGHYLGYVVFKPICS